MVKVHPAEVKLADLVMIGATPGVRTAITPFGSPYAVNRYVGRSVWWKGFKKAPDEPLERYLERFEGFLRGTTAANVPRGLSAAIRISRDHAGETGVVVAQYADGYIAIMPRKAASQSMGRPSEVRVGGRRPRTVRKYRVVSIVGEAATARVLKAMPGVPGAAPVPMPLPIPG